MILRKLTESDEAPMLELLTNEAIKKTYMLPDFEEKQEALPLFRRLVRLSHDSCHFVRGICEGDTVIGFLNDVEIENRSIELGYVIHPDHWGKGYATAALKAAIAELFSLGYQEITAGAFAENAASLRCMEKAGMTRLAKTDTIEYRGKMHLCVYCGIRKER